MPSDDDLRALVEKWREEYDGTRELSAYLWCADELEEVLEESG